MRIYKDQFSILHNDKYGEPITRHDNNVYKVWQFFSFVSDVLTFDLLRRTPDESSVAEQQQGLYVFVLYGWQKMIEKKSGTADKHHALREDR